MTQFAGILLSAVSIGCIYALVGAGFVLIYRATHVVSFAQGTFMLLGALVFYECTGSLNMELYLALACSTLLMGLLGAAVYYLVFSRVRVSETNHFTVAIATIALNTVLASISLLIWGSSTRQLPDVISAASTQLGPFRITPLFILLVFSTVVVIGALSIWLHRTRIGLKMRAVADSAEVATSLGVNVRHVAALAWGLGAAAAAVAGIEYAIGASISIEAIPALGLLVFPVILLGGLDSIVGALVGGFIVALVQAVTVNFIGGIWQEVAAYIVLLLALLIKPTGIFGSQRVIRV